MNRGTWVVRNGEKVAARHPVEKVADKVIKTPKPKKAAASEG